MVISIREKTLASRQSYLRHNPAPALVCNEDWLETKKTFFR